MKRVLWLVAILVGLSVFVMWWEPAPINGDVETTSSTNPAPAAADEHPTTQAPIYTPAVTDQSTACVLRASATTADRTAFLQRYSYLGLSEPELEKFILAIRQDGFTDVLLANYESEVSVFGDQSVVMGSESALADIDDNTLNRMREANRVLSSTYRAVQPEFYEYAEPEFDRALASFVETYREHSSVGAMLLYMHMRAAEQQYWRYSRQPDWRRWVHFEHHRQALIWFIQRYGEPEHIARIRQDRHLVSTVNRYSGQLDRGFGPVMGAPVDEKIEFYDKHFAHAESATGNTPKNYADDEGTVSYQKPEPGALDQLLAELWPNGSGRAVEDIFAAFAKDCQG